MDASMARRLTSLVVALAVLLPGVASPSPAMPGAGAGAHACCLRMKMQGCAGTTISCCPAPDRGRHTTPPPSSSSPAAGGSLDRVQHPSTPDAAPQPPLAKALAFDARAQARANAPPGPLYLKHLTLLV
jgi:hypothetical protein